MLKTAALTLGLFVITFLVSWGFVDVLFELADGAVGGVVGDRQLVFDSVTQPFAVYVRTAFASALLFASPFVLSIWVHRWTGNWIKPLATFLALDCAGAAVGYLVVFPIAAGFTDWADGAGPLVATEPVHLLLIVVAGLALALQVPVGFALAMIGRQSSLEA